MAFTALRDTLGELALEQEEPAADPAGGQGRLLVELHHLGARVVDVDLTEPAGRVDPGDRRQPAGGPVLPQLRQTSWLQAPLPAHSS